MTSGEPQCQEFLHYNDVGVIHDWTWVLLIASHQVHVYRTIPFLITFPMGVYVILHLHQVVVEVVAPPCINVKEATSPIHHVPWVSLVQDQYLAFQVSIAKNKILTLSFLFFCFFSKIQVISHWIYFALGFHEAQAIVHRYLYPKSLALWKTVYNSFTNILIFHWKCNNCRG